MIIKIVTDHCRPRVGQFAEHDGSIYKITQISKRYADDLYDVTAAPYDYGLHAGDDEKIVWYQAR